MKTPSTDNDSTRRQFLKKTGGAAGASALAGVSIPHVFAAEDNAIQLALVGCGGRGGGAANQALSVKYAPTKLVAMADVFDHKMKGAHKALSNAWGNKPEKMDVPKDRQFLGFDAYRSAMETLKPGSIVILTTPLAFRWVHFKYAIERGLHVFMEKPITADAPTSKRMLELSEKADAKNLKCGVGLMVRHCRSRQALYQRIRDGEIGDITFMRAYRMHGPVASAFSKKKPESQSEVMYQIERFHSFLWASGGLFNDFYIHQVDEVCWMKDAWPVKAHALGGRHWRGDFVDQNFDSYAVEYTFEDGTTYQFNGRTMQGAYSKMHSAVHGTKGAAVVSQSGHGPKGIRTFKNHRMGREDVLWSFPGPLSDPYQNEWDDLVEAIVQDQEYNEVPRGVRASLVSSMGRMSAHTGQEITWDQMVECPHEFAPNVDKMTAEGPAPVVADAAGRYPVPEPGKKKDREY